MQFCVGCEFMKKIESVTVHLTDIDKDYCSSKAEILRISNSDFIGSLITQSRLESEREFNIMKKVHGNKQNE